MNEGEKRHRARRRSTPRRGFVHVREDAHRQAAARRARGVSVQIVRTLVCARTPAARYGRRGTHSAPTATDTRTGIVRLGYPTSPDNPRPSAAMDSSEDTRPASNVEGVDGQRQSPPRCSTPQQMQPPSELHEHDACDSSQQDVSGSSLAQHESSLTGPEQQHAESDSVPDSGSAEATLQQQSEAANWSTTLVAMQSVSHAPPRPRGDNPPTARERPTTNDMTTRMSMLSGVFATIAGGAWADRNNLPRARKSNQTRPFHASANAVC